MGPAFIHDGGKSLNIQGFHGWSDALGPHRTEIIQTGEEQEAKSYSYTQRYNTYPSRACFYDNPVGTVFPRKVKRRTKFELCQYVVTLVYLFHPALFFIKELRLRFFLHPFIWKTPLFKNNKAMPKERKKAGRCWVYDKKLNMLSVTTNIFFLFEEVVKF